MRRRALWRCGLSLGLWLFGCRPVDLSALHDAATPSGGAVDLAKVPAVEDGPPLVGDLRAVTFNTHLFFDLVCDSGRCGPTDFEQVPSAQAFSDKADAVAKALRRMNGDVVALQEIENQNALDAVAGRLRDVYPTVVLGETGLPASIDVAVLSRGSLLSVRRYHDRVLTRPDGTKTTFSRELLEVHVSLRGRELVMFSAHFRSKSSDDPGRRLAEAQATADIIQQTAKEFPDAVIVLGGDLNDTPGSPPLAALEGVPGLLRVAKDRPLSSAATYSWNGDLQAIDHLFLWQSARVDYVAGSANAQHDATRFGLAGSDHAALLADFALH